MTLTTTLNRIKDCGPCSNVWLRGLKAAGKSKADDKPISYEAILDAVGLQHALWCCRAELQYGSLWRQYAVWCARQVQHLMTDPRSIAALDVAERYANGEATDEELAAAATAAAVAAVAAAAARAAVFAASGRSAAVAAAAARAAAADAAVFAASGRSGAVAAAAARAAAADAAAASAKAAARAAAAARDAQSAAFRQLITAGTLPPVQPIQEAIQ